MIRVDVGPRLSRSARRLGDQIVTEVEEKLTSLGLAFPKISDAGVEEIPEEEEEEPKKPARKKKTAE